MTKKTEKISIKEYTALKEKRDKARFKIRFYPWPVMLALLIPLSLLIILLVAYFFYVRNLQA